MKKSKFQNLIKTRISEKIMYDFMSNYCDLFYKGQSDRNTGHWGIQPL